MVPSHQLCLIVSGNMLVLLIIFQLGSGVEGEWAHLCGLGVTAVFV
jgi:hypothetical protein